MTIGIADYTKVLTMLPEWLSKDCVATIFSNYDIYCKKYTAVNPAEEKTVFILGDKFSTITDGGNEIYSGSKPQKYK